MAVQTIKTVWISLVMVFCCIWHAGMAGAKEIPVFPGARLVIEKAVNEEQMCCDFVTQDPFEKVLSFYEGALRIKPLDGKSLSTKYPDMKTQFDQMQKQMPPGMKIRFFALGEMKDGARTAVELFEVLGTPQGVKFSIMGQQLSSKDDHYVREWREEMGRANGVVTIKPVDASVLRGAFPALPPQGFENAEVDGNSGGDMVSVQASYRKLVKKGRGGEDGSSDQYVDVTLLITDTAGNSEYAREMLKAERREEKAIRVRGAFDGKESIETNAYGCVQSEKSFLVNNRFLVEIKGNGVCELALLNQIIEGMRLERLLQ